MHGFNIQDWGGAVHGFEPSAGYGSWLMGWIFPIVFWLLIVYLECHAMALRIKVSRLVLH